MLYDSQFTVPNLLYINDILCKSKIAKVECKINCW